MLRLLPKAALVFESRTAALGALMLNRADVLKGQGIYAQRGHLRTN